MTSKQCECGDEECGGLCDDSCGGSCSHKKGERLMEQQPEIDEETKREIVEYQNLQQQIQVMMMQRQQTLAAIAELDKAKEEVEKSAGNGAGATLYRFIGNVIVPKKKDELLNDLKDEKVGLESRRDVFQKQEERLRKRFDELQKKLQAKLGGPQSGGSGSEKSSGTGAKPKAKKAGAGDGAIFS